VAAAEFGEKELFAMKKARLLGLLLVLFGATVSAQQQQYLITTVAGRAAAHSDGSDSRVG
jgi:hypothetical protein